MSRIVTRVKLWSLVGGMALFHLAVVYFGGVLAAIAIPREYSLLFGREHVNAGLALVFGATWALPVAAAVAAGVGAILLSAGKLWRQASGFAFLGMLVTFAYYQVQSALLLQGSGAQPAFGTALLHSFAVPWFAAPNFVAPWLGFALGVTAVFIYRRGCAHARVV